MTEKKKRNTSKKQEKSEEVKAEEVLADPEEVQAEPEAKEKPKRKKNTKKLSEEEQIKAEEAELDKQVQELQEKKLNIRKDAETKKLQDVCCVDCGTNLGVDPSRHLVPTKVSEEYVCPKCDLVNYVLTDYSGGIDQEGSIKTIRRGFVWQEYPLEHLTEQQAIKLLMEDFNEVNLGTNQILPLQKRILKGLELVMKRLDMLPKEGE